ncbi:MAG: hypothetical protein ACFWTL_10235 [Atopobium sp.]
MGKGRQARHEALDAGNEALCCRRGFSKRWHSDAERDIVRLLEGDLCHGSRPFPADETLVEAHAESCLDHAAGHEAIGRLIAVLDMEPLLADQADLVRIMVVKRMDECLVLEIPDRIARSPCQRMVLRQPHDHLIPIERLPVAAGAPCQLCAEAEIDRTAVEPLAHLRIAAFQTARHTIYAERTHGQEASQAAKEKLDFSSDYLEGCADAIMDRLVATNHEKSAGYGLDEHSLHAQQLIKSACKAPSAEVFFLVGGTQTNEVAICALPAPWEGVICATSGRIAVHEAGAIEAGDHKVPAIPGHDGKLAAGDVDEFMRLWEKDGNRGHMVQPALICISQPDEYGLIYTKAGLEALRSVADARHLKICCDGARLAYALAAPENDDTLEDPAHLTDAFFIGGTKCGALFGEALVFPKPELVPPLLHVREAARSPPCQGTSARRPIRGLLRGWAL